MPIINHNPLSPLYSCRTIEFRIPRRGRTLNKDVNIERDVRFPHWLDWSWWIDRSVFWGFSKELEIWRGVWLQSIFYFTIRVIYSSCNWLLSILSVWFQFGYINRCSLLILISSRLLVSILFSWKLHFFTLVSLLLVDLHGLCVQFCLRCRGLCVLINW